jgi:hypothetical protein
VATPAPLSCQLLFHHPAKPILHVGNERERGEQRASELKVFGHKRLLHSKSCHNLTDGPLTSGKTGQNFPPAFF